MAEEIVIKAKIEGAEADQSIERINSGLKEVSTNAESASQRAGKSLSKFSESTEAVTNSYVALQSVMLLTNNESDEMAKILVKISAVQMTFNSIKAVGNSLMAENNILTRAGNVATKAYGITQKIFTAVTEGTTGAMKALRIAMLALPILLIIAGVVALVAILYKLNSSQNDTVKSTKLLAEAQKEAKISAVDETSALVELQDRINKVGDDREALTKIVEDFKDTHEGMLQGLDDEVITREALSEIIQENIDMKEKEMKVSILQEKFNDALKAKIEAEEKLKTGPGYWDVFWYGADGSIVKNLKEVEKAKKQAIENMKALQKAKQELNASQKELGVDPETKREKKKADDLLKIQQDASSKKADESQKAWEARQAQIKKQHEQELALEESHNADLQKVIDLAQDIQIASIEDETDREIATIAKRYEREIQATKEKYKDSADIVAQLEENRQKEIDAIQETHRTEQAQKELDLERRLNIEKAQNDISAIANRNAENLEISLQNIQDTFDAEQELRDAQKEQELNALDITEQEKELIREKYRQLDISAEKAKQDKITAEQKKEQDKRTDLQGKAFDALNNLNDLVFTLSTSRLKKGSKEEEKAAKKKFQVNKGLQLAQATITGIQSVMSAFASGNAVPIIGPATGAAYAIIAGIASAANIAKIASAKFDAGGGGGGAESASIPSAPNIADLGAGTFNPNGDFPRMDDIGQNGKGKDNIKVTLTDSDLKASQKNNKKVEIISKG